jgi:hypothetical protein
MIPPDDIGSQHGAATVPARCVTGDYRARSAATVSHRSDSATARSFNLTVTMGWPRSERLQLEAGRTEVSDILREVQGRLGAAARQRPQLHARPLLISAVQQGDG